MFPAPYTDQELIDDAKKFSTRAEWRAAGEVERLIGKASHYGSAIKRGREFMEQCCGHMPHGHSGHTHWRKYSDEELVSAAKLYQHKSDWKKEDYNTYQTALLRPEVFQQATTHMTPKASPYSGSYIIYAYEFTDHYAYVGLTFLDKARHVQHMIRGPVFRHLAICPTYEYKIIERGLASPVEAIAAEKKWIEHYARAGWTMLNVAKAGGLGTVNIGKWTKEAVLAKAKEYKTRKAWYLGSQFTYSLAKREGWFEQAAAHMPRRVLGIGAGKTVSAETKEKQRQAKVGKTQSTEQRQAKAAAIKKWWADRKSKAAPAKTPGVAEAIVNSLL
jgi:hypothetical protein